MTSYIEAVEKMIDQHNTLPIRIKELEERNKELTLQLLATSGQAADALDKLAKAVEALRFYAPTKRQLGERWFIQNFGGSDDGERAATALAELEGKE